MSRRFLKGRESSKHFLIPLLVIISLHLVLDLLAGPWRLRKYANPPATIESKKDEGVGNEKTPTQS
jgi:hypothetical protein